MTKEDAKCIKCGHTWRKRVDNPTQCPKCTARKWHEPPIRKQIQMQESKKLEETINNRDKKFSVPKFEVNDGTD